MFDGFDAILILEGYERSAPALDDETWLHALKRRHLGHGRSDADLLAMRADKKFAHEVADACQREIGIQIWRKGDSLVRIDDRLKSAYVEDAKTLCLIPQELQTYFYSIDPTVPPLVVGRPTPVP